MRNRLLAALSLVCIAGAFSFAGAQVDSRIKTANEVTPTWTGKGKYWGFVTCDKLQRQGTKITVDEIKKCVADGGKYVFGRTPIDPAAQAKLAPFAGQHVEVVATMTAARYGTGPTSDVAVDGLPSGGDRPATRQLGIVVVSVKVDPEPADPSISGGGE